MAELVVVGKKNGRRVILLDDEDLSRIAENGPWFVVMVGPDRRPYAARNTKHSARQSIHYMHRFLKGDPCGLVVDHINGNGLDNRKHNLRVCTRAENNMNSRIPSNNTSGVKGVSFDASRGKWAAQIGFRGRDVRIGRYSSLEEAADAVLEARARLHGEYSNNG